MSALTTPLVAPSGLVEERTPYTAQSARDAERMGYGGRGYCDHLEESALRHHAYYTERGMTDRADLMLTRSLGESLAGNDGI